MIRGASRRVAALFGALLFLLSTAGEGFGLHPCPYHDSLDGTADAQTLSGGEAAHADAGHSAHDAHTFDADADYAGGGHDHATAAHDRAADAAASHPAGHHEDGEICTHLGLCQPPSGAVIPDDVTAAFGWGTRSVTASIVPSIDRIAAAYPAYFLPYSLAPPARG